VWWHWDIYLYFVVSGCHIFRSECSSAPSRSRLCVVVVCTSFFLTSFRTSTAILFKPRCWVLSSSFVNRPFGKVSFEAIRYYPAHWFSLFFSFTSSRFVNNVVFIRCVIVQGFRPLQCFRLWLRFGVRTYQVLWLLFIISYTAVCRRRQFYRNSTGAFAWDAIRHQTQSQVIVSIGRSYLFHLCKGRRVLPSQANHYKTYTFIYLLCLVGQHIIIIIGYCIYLYLLHLLGQLGHVIIIIIFIWLLLLC
jgi:hypothetical protein